MIQIKGLSKRYEGSVNHAVKEINLKISDGEIFGLLGPNGAGKTTLISMLCSLLEPSAGSLEINSLDFKKNKNELKQIIGIVPQEIALYASMTAYENMQYFGGMYGLKGKDLKDRISTHLEILGLTEFAHKRIGQYSGGMKRRINLAASILHEPKVLFLDEPTVGVDVQSKRAIIEHLIALNKKGCTILYTSHHLNEAEQFCTEVAIMDHGSLIIQGKPEALIAEKKVKNLEELFITLTGEKLRDHA
jgi:ABC-2 type transport system ATP-binding protein